MTSTEHRDGNVALEAGIQRVASHLLRGPLRDATTFIDFGAFCGYTIATLATHFPRTWFIGIDRPEIAKSLNDQAFGRKNVEFLDGDILDLVASRESFGARPVLFHSRTAVFCYPEYLRQLYRICAEKGIRDIVMQEGSTFFSRWYLRFFEPGKYPAISFAGRGSTFLHDYMTLLREAGFEIRSSKDIRPKLLLDDRSGFGADHRIVHASLRR
jgi:ubiquinone/menaquinone biosynthesis C-methylase UbiE